MRSIKIQSLQNRLQHFGLDPKDWQVRESIEGTLTIQHLEDPEVALQGHAYSQGHTWDWQEIRWAAI